MIASGEKKIGIVCRDCIIICDWSYNDKGKIHEGGDQIIKLDKIERIKISEVPTAIKVGKYSLYVGYQSGKIYTIKAVFPNICSEQKIGKEYAMIYSFPLCKWKS